MSRLTLVMPVFAAIIATYAPMTWAQCENPPPLDKLVRGAQVIATGFASSIEGDPSSIEADWDETGRECVWFTPEEFLRGQGSPGVHRICYDLNRRLPGMAGVPAVQPGERVLVFASAEHGSELDASAHQTSVISPSNVSCALDWGHDGYEFNQVEQTVRRGLEYIAGDPATQQAIAIEFAKSGRLEMLAFLGFEVSAATNPDLGRPITYDPAPVVQALLTVARGPDHRAALDAFLTARTLDGKGPATAWLFNETMDLALEWMESEDLTLRRHALAHARDQRCIEARRPMMDRCADLTFGFDPEGPADERRAAVQRWQQWWSANRGQGRFDTSPERIAELNARAAQARREAPERARRKGEDLKWRLEHGLTTIDLSHPYSTYQLRYLAAAGYELAPDGRVVPLGSVADGGTSADGVVDGGGPDGGGEAEESGSDAMAGGADAEAGAGAAPNGEPRRGCGCRVPASPAGVEAVFLLPVAWLAARASVRRRPR